MSLFSPVTTRSDHSIDLSELFRLYPQCPQEAITRDLFGYLNCIRQEQLMEAMRRLTQEVERSRSRGSFSSGMVIGGAVGAGIRHLFTLRGAALVGTAYILRGPLMKVAPKVWDVMRRANHYLNRPH